MSRPLLLDACVVIDFAECGVELLALASRHLGPVHVAIPALAEVKSVALGTAAIQAIEPTIAELEEAALGGGGLSFADRVTLVLALRRGFVVVTSDRALRRACLASDIEVLWSLEVVLELVAVHALSPTSAEAAVRIIHERNPWHVNPSVLAAFLEQLAMKRRTGST